MIKLNLKKYIILLLAVLLQSCSTQEKIIIYENINNENSMTLEFTKGKSFNHPTFVIWLEDMEGNYLKTLFITKSYAECFFKNKLLGDTLWIPESGKSHQPAALSFWTHKKGLINNKTLIPTRENSFIDAFTGATPDGSFIFKTKKSEKNNYRLLVEINQTWDWNKYWTNNKFPDNSAYKHSAQPSIIYEVKINDTDNIYFLNPVGHGDPKGESGKLYTNISTLTSAKNIFSSIKIKINK